MTMQVQYLGHEVVDPNHQTLGKISDVLHDRNGDPEWAVVDLGLFRSAHFVPIDSGYMSDDGTFVVPYDRKALKSAPKADRNHVIDRATQQELEHYYRN